MKLPSALDKILGRGPDDTAVAAAFARCFSSADGATVLEHLHRHCFFRPLDPKTDADTLRFVEGQRQLVLWICHMTAKAKSNPQRRETK
jgi:hypothetical protein